MEKKEITLARPIIKAIRKAAATFNNRLIAAAPTDTSSTSLQSSKHQRHVLEEWSSVYHRPTRYHLSVSRTFLHLTYQGVGLFPSIPFIRLVGGITMPFKCRINGVVNVK